MYKFIEIKLLNYLVKFSLKFLCFGPHFFGFFMSRASLWYILRRTYVESKFRPYSASSGTRWYLTIKITLKSAFLGSITSSKGLEVNVLSILIFLKIFISQGPILKIEVLMTLIEISRQFYIILLKK